MGTFAKFPKRRGFSSGRIKGYKKAPRTRHDVIKKGSKKSTENLKAPWFSSESID
ncbi:hypothetical protein CWATWH8502_1471 [Crocosphaera watsonii WH 8502]|uniref:Uncharacterized protein n=2 Tax=Crocosphaera watsonii WH 8502 TaxID=423474 RepID=T2II45_CROWT|nr:hypothetical protein CWATWH8502_1471 [Crocosphaera watsonii WH 8502]